MKAILVAMRENLMFMGLVPLFAGSILTIVLSSLDPEAAGASISFIVTAFGAALVLTGAVSPRLNRLTSVTN